MKLKLDMSRHLLNAYTKFQIDISKHVEKKSGKLGRTDGRTDGQTDGHCHSIIRPFFKRAYNKTSASYWMAPTLVQHSKQHLQSKFFRCEHIHTCIIMQQFTLMISVYKCLDTFRHMVVILKKKIQMHFLQWKCINFDLKFFEVCSRVQLAMFWLCSDNGLAATRRQTIIWTNDG